MSGAASDEVRGPGLVSGAALDAVRGLRSIVRSIRGPGLGSHIGFLNHFKIFTGNF